MYEQKTKPVVTKKPVMISNTGREDATFSSRPGDAAGWHHKVIGGNHLHTERAMAFQLSPMHMVWFTKSNNRAASPVRQRARLKDCSVRLLISITSGHEWPRSRSNTLEDRSPCLFFFFFPLRVLLNYSPAEESEICQQSCCAAHANAQPAGTKM